MEATQKCLAFVDRDGGWDDYINLAYVSRVRKKSEKEIEFTLNHGEKVIWTYRSAIKVRSKCEKIWRKSGGDKTRSSDKSS